MLSFALKAGVILCLCSIVSLRAQQMGSIQGYVYDDQQDPLLGAHILLMGTSKGAISADEGFFEIKQVPVGKHRIEVSYVASETKIVTVTVQANKEAEVQVVLADLMHQMEQVKVYAKRTMDNEAALLDMQRKSISIIEGLSAEQINKVGAVDVASAVQRMTGLTVEDGKYVYVRGLGDRYNRVFLNGASLPSLDPNRNSTQLDIFPSHLVNNIVVHKSFNPSLSGNFTGGYLNIETKNVPTQRYLSVSLSTSYNPNTNLNGQFLNYQSGWGDFFAAGKQHRQLPALAHTDIPSISEAQKIGSTASRSLAHATQAFGQHQLAPTTGSASLDHNLKATYGDRLFIGKSPIGYLISLTHTRQYDAYRQGNSGIYKPVGKDTRALIPLYTLRDNNSTEDVLLGALLGLNYSLTPKNTLSFTFLHNRKGTKSTRQQTGRKPEDAPDLRYFTNGLWYTQRQLFTYQLLGKHEWNPGIEANWVGSYTRATIDQPDLRFFTFGARDTDQYRVEPSTGQLPTHYYRDMAEDLADIRLHLGYTLQPKHKLLLGGAYEWGYRRF